MAAPGEYQSRIRRLKWPGLKQLWEEIKAGNTPGWEPGKAFEYLVMRLFELDGAEVRWPYSVPLFGNAEVEQIDGSVRCGSLYCLVESKDEADNISVGPIAKLRNQLLRRPAGTVGLLFSRRGFTDPAVQLAYFTLPQPILLWTGAQVEFALNQRKIRDSSIITSIQLARSRCSVPSVPERPDFCESRTISRAMRLTIWSCVRTRYTVFCILR